MCVHDLSTNNVLKLDKFYGRNLNTASVRQGRTLKIVLYVIYSILIPFGILFHSSPTFFEWHESVKPAIVIECAE